MWIAARVSEKAVPTPVKAHFALPDTPGFGIELDAAKVESQQLLKW